MEETPTCGKGLAAHTAMPRQIASLAAAMSGLLEAHTKALDPREASGRAEREAYLSLSRQYAEVSERLLALADEAEGYRTLEMAAHDMAFMTSQEPLEAFEAVVAARRRLLALLQAGTEQDEAMLQSMRRSIR